MSENRPVLGLSACLNGDAVRYDGAHKRDTWLLDKLGKHVDYRTFCPEVGIGLSIPRPPIRLAAVDGQTRVVGVKDPDQDFTEQLRDYAEKMLPRLTDVSGFVFKSKSPSCGAFRVKRYDGARYLDNHGEGAFAAAIKRAMPWLPVEEEGRLCDAVLRENFVNRVYVYWRWQKLTAREVKPADLLGFHAQHKYLLMAHSQAAYKRLGRLLSDLKNAELQTLLPAYLNELMAALSRRVSRARHVNVLQHIQGYLKQSIESEDKVELAAAIEDYRRGEVPLVVPIRLMQHHFRRHPDGYIADQVYLDPHPASLGLRNHV